MDIKLWIEAFRLRTLPLALSNALLGSLLAWAAGGFRWEVFVLATLTILFLQILSNLANDYGDALHGTDNENRIGPQRFTQSGIVTKAQMRGMITLFALLSLLTGLLLVFTGLRGADPLWVSGFILLGLAAIFAAIKYTIGKKPYGYIGLGDLFVFIFFGLVGVMGTYYLHTGSFDPFILLPASSIGLLSTGVLNLNNMRDIDNDRQSGKHTMAVILGRRNAKVYHSLLIGGALVLASTYVAMSYSSWCNLLFIVSIPLFARGMIAVWKNKEPHELNPELKKLAISTFIFSLLLGLGMAIAC